LGANTLAMAVRRAMRFLPLILLAPALPGVANTVPVPPEPAALTQPFDPQDPADALIMSQTQEAFVLTRRFEAPLGLRGYLLASALGQPVVLYADPQGTHLVLGALLTAAGENAATAVLQDYLEEQLLPHLYAAFGAATFIHQGQPQAPLLYVLFDPACPHCSQLYHALLPRVAAGDVAVRWLPVNTLGQEDQVARLVEAARQGQGETTLAAVFGGEAEAALASLTPTAETTEALAANQELYAALGAGGIPKLFYQAKSGGFQLARGAPEPEELALIL